MVAGFSEAGRSRLFGSIAGQQAALWRLAEGVRRIRLSHGAREMDPLGASCQDEQDE